MSCHALAPSRAKLASLEYMDSEEDLESRTAEATLRSESAR